MIGMWIALFLVYMVACVVVRKLLLAKGLLSNGPAEVTLKYIASEIVPQSISMAGMILLAMVAQPLTQISVPEWVGMIGVYFGIISAACLAYLIIQKKKEPVV